MIAPATFILSEKASTFFWFSIILMFFIGFATPRTMAFLPGIIGLGFVLYIFLKEKFLVRPDKNIVIIFGVTSALLLLSALWAPETAFAVEKALKSVLILFSGLLFLTVSKLAQWPSKQNMLKPLIILYVIASAFFFHEMMNGQLIAEFVLNEGLPAYKLNRSFVVFALFAIPLLALIKSTPLEKTKKIALMIFIILIASASIIYTGSQTAQLSFICGLFFLFIFPLRPAIFTKLLLGFIILFTLAFPFTVKTLQTHTNEEILTQGILRQASIVHRLEVWNYSAEKTFQSPVYGNGLEALRFLKSDIKMVYMPDQNALHAHNVVLQFWAEFGLIGALLGVLFVIFIFKKILQETNLATRRLYLSVFMTCLSCAMTGYGFWQGWQVGLFIALTGLSFAIANQQKDGNKKDSNKTL